ncbi:hypothetical protein SK128_003217 [Halocaridina rubra]|uniref:Uncharacterized protein n=1 Tax=Halocaridina rubra TaxID=373956 RepID=A0AAN8WGC7_HALRR
MEEYLPEYEKDIPFAKEEGFQAEALTSTCVVSSLKARRSCRKKGREDEGPSAMIDQAKIHHDALLLQGLLLRRKPFLKDVLSAKEFGL